MHKHWQHAEIAAAKACAGCTFFLSFPLPAGAAILCAPRLCRFGLSDCQRARLYGVQTIGLSPFVCNPFPCTSSAAALCKLSNRRNIRWRRSILRAEVPAPSSCTFSPRANYGRGLISMPAQVHLMERWLVWRWFLWRLLPNGFANRPAR